MYIRLKVTAICITIVIILLASSGINVNIANSEYNINEEVEYSEYELWDIRKTNQYRIDMNKYIDSIGEDTNEKDEKKNTKKEHDYIRYWSKCTLNFRKSPSTDSEVLYTVDIGTEISAYDYNNDWVYGKYKGKNVYVYKKYLSKTKINKKSYTDDELYVLSHLMMGESGGESDKCQLYVGSVVLNRVKDNRFPNSIREVAFQKGQYACTWDGNYNKKPTKKVIKNAKRLLEYGSQLPEYVIYQSGFKQGKKIYTIVDGEYFCY